MGGVLGCPSAPAGLLSGTVFNLNLLTSHELLSIIVGCKLIYGVFNESNVSAAPPASYLPQDGLADLFLQQSVDALHFGGRAGRPVHVGARRVEEAPLFICQLGENERAEINKNDKTNKNDVRSFPDE